MTVNVDQCFAVVDDIILSCGRRRGVSHQRLSPLRVSWFGILADFFGLEFYGASPGAPRGGGCQAPASAGWRPGCPEFYPPFQIMVDNGLRPSVTGSGELESEASIVGHNQPLATGSTSRLR
jgi:hypothetical protein